MNEGIDKTGRCQVCGQFIEHFAGEPGSEFMTPFWRHAGLIPDPPHPAVLDPGSEQEVPK